MSRFGWCMTGQHRTCWITNGKHECDCPCPHHGEDAKRPDGEHSPLMQELIEKYGIGDDKPKRKKAADDRS